MEICRKEVPAIKVAEFNTQHHYTDKEGAECLDDRDRKLHYQAHLSHPKDGVPVFTYWNNDTDERIRIHFTEDEPIVCLYVKNMFWFALEDELKLAIFTEYYKEKLQAGGWHGDVFCHSCGIQVTFQEAVITEATDNTIFLCKGCAYEARKAR